MLRIDPRPLERGFYKSARFKNLVRVASAAFTPRLTGGFDRAISALQGSWPALSEGWARDKAKQGWDARKWVRTGRTIAALAGGRPEREGTKAGIRFKLTPGRLWAVIRPTTFGPAKRSSRSRKTKRGKSRKPANAVQKRIFNNLNYGIDAAGKAAAAGKTIKSKRGRRMSGFPARSLFVWKMANYDDSGMAREAAETEFWKIFREGGGT